MRGHDIIVIGASAGGVETLMKLVGGLPADFPAAVFIVLHLSAQGPSMLPQILSRSGSLVATHPVDGEEIKHGHIYIAPPDYHMLLEQGYVRVIRGPKENRHRPAIDPLFRSAALIYGPSVVGVVLTGSLDDGTAGLLAIKRRHGMAIVQVPNEALFPDMPQNAISHVAVDAILPISAIAPRLVELAHTAVEDDKGGPVSKDMEKEVQILKMQTSPQNDDTIVGQPSVYSCPECGGVLWEILEGELLRFRCRVGHAFSPDSMMTQQSEAVEEAMWTALKILEEHASISHRMAVQSQQRGQVWLARRFEEKEQQAQQQAALLISVLKKGEVDTDNGQRAVSQEERDKLQNP